MKQLALDIARPPAPALDNFVPGRNAELVVALYAIANGASSERFIYMWGEPGSGRSHLLRAVVNAAQAAGREALLFESGASTFETSDEMLCAVDDVHRLTPAAQIAFFNLHNRIRAGTGTLIASGDVAPAGLALRADVTLRADVALRADVITRLGSGLVYQVHGLNEDEKVAALRRHAQARGFDLSPEVVTYLLRRVQRDLPSLLALLDALDRYSLASRRAITLPLLRELLNE
ncbi:MAG TPA: DnaA regulatory inactivator Hda [Burkholderiales bacterium]|jgi:DnaA family protein|nr:DnaA regulatory inactivator Hda [Burkholderiales bacterium]